jgi:hypothetical protein
MIFSVPPADAVFVSARQWLDSPRTPIDPKRLAEISRVLKGWSAEHGLAKAEAPRSETDPELAADRVDQVVRDLEKGHVPIPKIHTLRDSCDKALRDDMLRRSIR